jgi:hypothetical protein
LEQEDPVESEEMFKLAIQTLGAYKLIDRPRLCVVDVPQRGLITE